MPIKNRILNWIYSTWIGDLYFKYLIWIDSKSKSNVRFLTPGEAATIIREYSLVSEGVVRVKSKVNQLITAKTKEEYHKVLSEVENMILLAGQEKYESPDKLRFANIVREMAVKKGNKDVVTPQDKLNMIYQRIEDYKELHQHQAKRNLMRQLRRARQEKNVELVTQLEAELKGRYGRN